MTQCNNIYKKKSRKFLYEHEISQILQLCNNTRYPLRNECLILLTYNHAYRAGEVCKLQWDQIDFSNNTLTVLRQKGGVNSIHPLGCGEKELLLSLKDKMKNESPYVFTTDKWGDRFEPQNFYRLTLNLGKMAGFDFIFTPHMLRHSKGTFLATNDINLLKIKNYLGHKRISSTELYIHMAANQFKGINEGSMFI